jgi:uncharacterized zinc-type alcohol dehydrogenase-like protein
MKRNTSMTVNAYCAYAGDKPLEPMEIERRAPGAHDGGGICKTVPVQRKCRSRSFRVPAPAGHTEAVRKKEKALHRTACRQNLKRDIFNFACVKNACRGEAKLLSNCLP